MMPRKVPPPKSPTGLYFARTFRGMSQDELAERAGTTKGQISKLEKGPLAKDGRKLTREWAERFAPVLDIPAERILFWDRREAAAAGPPTEEGNEGRKVPVVGYVQAGAQAQYRPLHDSILDRVDPPHNATAKTVAFEIRGDSLGELFDRWLVFFDDVRSPVTPDLVGRLCVVGLDDGRVMIKKLIRGKRGLFTLLSDQARQEPIENVSVQWAARVKTMVPR